MNAASNITHRHESRLSRSRTLRVSTANARSKIRYRRVFHVRHITRSACLWRGPAPTGCQRVCPRIAENAAPHVAGLAVTRLLTQAQAHSVSLSNLRSAGRRSHAFCVSVGHVVDRGSRITEAANAQDRGDADRGRLSANTCRRRLRKFRPAPRPKRGSSHRRTSPDGPWLA
jgi:hypothetical protein